MVKEKNLLWSLFILGFPGGSVVKNLSANAGKSQRHRLDPWVGKMPWRRKWQPTPVFLPGESHGQRSLAGYSPSGHKESDVTEHILLSICKALPISIAKF